MSATRTAERESTQIPRASWTCSTHQRTGSPRSSMGRCTPTRGPPMPHARASSSPGVKIGGPFDYDAGGPISIRPFDAITFSLGNLWP